MKRIAGGTCDGKDTHKHEGYRRAFKFARDQFIHRPDHNVLDLFARSCPWGDFRNDLNPKFKKNGLTNMSMDALECAKSFNTSTISIILFDPPFSPRQDIDKYGEVGRASIWTDPKYVSDLGKEMFRILEPGGYLIKCGYNSNAPDPRMQYVKGYVQHYGACRNDVLFTIWQKMDGCLNQYF